MADGLTPPLPTPTTVSFEKYSVQLREREKEGGRERGREEERESGRVREEEKMKRVERKESYFVFE